MGQILKLKKSNCKNCYKCIRNCAVKSIKFSGNQAHIVDEECVLCGQCFVVCPQNAKEIDEETEKAKVLLCGGAPVVASVAPSFVANYGGIGIASLEAALKKLGFHSAQETAIGATIVKKQYEKILDKGQEDIIISSCCHSVNLLIQKHFPFAAGYLASVVSPMLAHCADIKKRMPGAKTVFIGPCVSKKDEARRYGKTVDCVLTFEELTRWLDAENIKLEQKLDASKNSRARLFPTSGGILKTMDIKNKAYKYIAVDGMSECISALEDIKEGIIKRCFIEMSACRGSCIGGPVMEKKRCSAIKSYMRVLGYAGDKDFSVATDAAEPRVFDIIDIPKTSRPCESQIREILKQMGKRKPEDELNCGSCGYNSCRDKAEAVYHGKAVISMCLPFLNERAESFSDNIINNTPNAIIVLNEHLEVQQINNAACRLMNLSDGSLILGEQIARAMDPYPFMQIKNGGANIREKKVYLAEYGKYVEQTILYDKGYRILICIMRDITCEENSAMKKAEIKAQTADIADKVVDKQMRIVQDIASLLGETAAETKIALTKLKESILDE